MNPGTRARQIDHRIPTRLGSHRLSVVLVSIVLVASLVIGLALAAAFGAYTYRQQQRQIDTRIAELVESNVGGLSLAIWTFDFAAAELQLKGLTNTFPVKSAEIVAADGSVVRSAVAPVGEKPAGSRRLVRVSSLDNTERVLGTLNIYLDRDAMQARVVAGVRNIVVVVIVSSVLIALFVAMIMQTLIAAPLRRLADQLHLTTAGGKPLEVNYDTGNLLRARILEIEELAQGSHDGASRVRPAGCCVATAVTAGGVSRRGLDDGQLHGATRKPQAA